MALAAYKDLCIDANDAHAHAAFWGAALGWEAHHHDDGNSCLRVGDEDVRVWVNAVPEPVTVKNRLHLDIRAGSLDAVVAAGAEVIDEQPRWTVLRDPDGQEFCVFVRDEPVSDRFYELVWDVTGNADDAHRMAQWWAEAIGGAVVRGDGFSHIENMPGLPFEAVVFQAVPEEKIGKNRIHIDVTTDDIGPLVVAGATSLRDKGADGVGWCVMTDPAGNEFCAFTPD